MDEVERTKNIAIAKPFLRALFPSKLVESVYKMFDDREYHRYIATGSRREFWIVEGDADRKYIAWCDKHAVFCSCPAFGSYTAHVEIGPRAPLCKHLVVISLHRALNNGGCNDNNCIVHELEDLEFGEVMNSKYTEAIQAALRIQYRWIGENP